VRFVAISPHKLCIKGKLEELAVGKERMEEKKYYLEVEIVHVLKQCLFLTKSNQPFYVPQAFDSGDLGMIAGYLAADQNMNLSQNQRPLGMFLNDRFGHNSHKKRHRA
jgi:hypothetical protein